MARDFKVTKLTDGTWTASTTTVVSRKANPEKGIYEVRPTEYSLTIRLNKGTTSALSDVQVAGLRPIIEAAVDQWAITASRGLVEDNTSEAGIHKALGIPADAKPVERNKRMIFLGGKFSTSVEDLTAEKERTTAPPTAEKLAAQAEKMTEEEQKALLQKLLAKFAEQTQA